MRPRLSRSRLWAVPAAVAAAVFLSAAPAAADCNPDGELQPVTPMAIEAQDFANRAIGPVFEKPPGRGR